MANAVEKIQTYYKETLGEAKKCTWPNRAELKESTIIVIATVLLLAAFIFVTDQLVTWIVTSILEKL